MEKLKKYLPAIIVVILFIIGIIFWVNYQRKRQSALNQPGNGGSGNGGSGNGSGQQQFEPRPTPSGSPAMDDPNVVSDTELPNPPAGFAGLGVER